MDSRNRYVIPRDDPPDVEASGGQQVVNLDHPHTVEKGNKPTPPSTMVKILIYAILLFRSGAAFGFILGVVFMGMFDAIHIVISFFITVIYPLPSFIEELTTINSGSLCGYTLYNFTVSLSSYLALWNPSLLSLAASANSCTN